MTINIHQLLKKLVSYTDINFDMSHISSEAKTALSIMTIEFKELEKSIEPNKQEQMITLFIGGIVLAIYLDDGKYNNAIYSSEVHQQLENIVTGLLTSELIRKVGAQALMVREPELKEGEQTLSKSGQCLLPLFFNKEIFEAETRLRPIPFFPGLSKNFDKIDLLVKFCTTYRADLNKPEVEIEELDLFAPPVARVGFEDKETLKSDSVASGRDVPAALVTNKQSEENQSPTQVSSALCSNMNMQILGGFITALGIAAVVTAFVVLNAATLGTAGIIVASLGTAAILGGFGLFVNGACKKCQSMPGRVLDEPLSFV